MKKALLALFAVVVLAAAGGYLYFAGKEYVFRISERDLQQKLHEKLPLTRKYFFIIEVTLDHPRVALVNGSDRVKAGLDIVLNVGVGDQPRPLGGTIDVTSGVRYVASTGEFFLTDPVIDQLTVQGIPKAYSKQATEAATKAIAEYFSRHPVYTLSASDAKQAAAWMVLKNVVVEDDHLVVTLGI